VLAKGVQRRIPGAKARGGFLPVNVGVKTPTYLRSNGKSKISRARAKAQESGQKQNP